MNVVRSVDATPRRPLVLIIEDNVTQLDLYALVLEEQFDVVRATRGETGYALAVAQHPAAVVIDVMLPDVDGLTVCARLRANPATSGIPLIVLTGDDEALARARAMRFRLKDVLTKPCSADRLIGVIRAAVAPHA